MKQLKALAKEVKVVLARGGSSEMRRHADHEIVHKSFQGMRMAKATGEATEADYCTAAEEWTGKVPQPRTPREDHDHARKARTGRLAEWFLFALKIVFWIVLGPYYFAALAWKAVLIALGVSVPMGIGVKPLIAAMILKGGSSSKEKESRLHMHTLAGVILFLVTFGLLFFLRGLIGQLALIGKPLLLPVLSACDLVLLYLIGIAHAYAHLYGWGRSYVEIYFDAAGYFNFFEQHHHAAQIRLGQNPTTNSVIGPERSNAATTKKIGVIGALMIVVVSLNSCTEPGSASPPAPSLSHTFTDVRVDSTTSVYKDVSEAITDRLVGSVFNWSTEIHVGQIRISTFERDGWMPRTIKETYLNGTPAKCKSDEGEVTIFRGMADASNQEKMNFCLEATNREAERVRSALKDAIVIAWKAKPLVDPKTGISCTAFKDSLSSAGQAPAGNLIVIVSDTEETCKKGGLDIPARSGGADVIIVVVPSQTDMGPGVSAADRFEEKKRLLQKAAPWIKAILSPAEVEGYRLSAEIPH